MCSLPGYYVPGAAVNRGYRRSQFSPRWMDARRHIKGTGFSRILAQPPELNGEYDACEDTTGYHEGARDFSRAVRWRRGAVQQLRCDLPLGGRARLQGRAGSDLGCTADRPRKAASSQTYCDEIAGVAARQGLAITELSTHLQGQLVAVHPAYDEAFDGFAPPQVRGKPKARQGWAVDQMMQAAKASRRLGLTGSVTSPARWPGPSSIPGRSGRRA